MPALQNFTADRMSLVTPPSSNGWNIPLTCRNVELFPEISLILSMDPNLEPDPSPGGLSTTGLPDPDPQYSTRFKYALRYHYPSWSRIEVFMIQNRSIYANSGRKLIILRWLTLGFSSFSWRKMTASKHWRWSQVAARHGKFIRMPLSGQIRDTWRTRNAISNIGVTLDLANASIRISILTLLLNN